MATKQLPGDVEFTYEWYRQLLEGIQERVVNFEDVSTHLEPGDILLRHDVDLSVTDAKRMARLEADCNVASTYCFMLTSSLYNALENDRAEAIREIESLGHEIALHFDTHNYWDEEPAEVELEEQVAEEQSILATITNRFPSTVSFHRPPSWVLDRRFSSFTSTYSPAFFGDTNYVADSNQRWREEPPVFDTTGGVQVLTHPGLWGESDAPFDERVERGIIESNMHSNRRATEEFVSGGMNQ